MPGYSDKQLFEEGLLIEDCTNVFIEGLIEDDTYMGAIYPQEFGSQVPNLLITGTTSGVHLKNMDIASGEGKTASEDLGIPLMWFIFGAGEEKRQGEGRDGGGLPAAASARGNAIDVSQTPADRVPSPTVPFVS